MMRYTFLLFLIASFGLHAQTDDETAAKQAVVQFFDGFHKKDSVLMQEVVHKDLILQTTFTNKKGEAVLKNQDATGFIKAVVSRADSPIWKEKILSYSVQVDGTMANVWTPYEFWLNGKFLHCGVNSFQLFKDNGTWKIIYLIDTRRKEGCQEK
ncbi:nuclear transport factor 2 family protein [Kordia sp. YSTF-M3]|uniref:Nuclear transport factor 2 family protein n=1 Tax=Kordia aestuariivivens TaxID=2759037 RepID=A0ABR7Q7N7_9FLAO|nr:nuclear transport factor 2 family protein [Kordia aestuariivivens]MBC8754587.1 nuclear transport factor 2 family protein [Kordia aestuariivivens]